MEPWWHEYVRDAMLCIDQKDYQEARALLAEIVEYVIEKEGN